MFTMTYIGNSFFLLKRGSMKCGIPNGMLSVHVTNHKTSKNT